MTLRAFDPEQARRAKLFLATKVADMMGRKFEEEDWAQVYCAAKGIPLSAWSNLDIDIMSGSLGVEHKMICWDGKQSILEVAGTARMHPAGTRAVRFPREETDPTRAAHDILRQYGALIDSRSEIVRIVNAYHHGRATRPEAVSLLQAMGMSRKKALQIVPEAQSAAGIFRNDVDMRIGWLIWQRRLEEFLYFEERMEKPVPEHYRAEWSERAAGRRRESRNLWVYDIRSGTKVYSITNEAGTKIQPYFSVPPLGDPDLFHFCVQGEAVDDISVRVWVTPDTKQQLEARLGPLTSSSLAAAIAGVEFPDNATEEARRLFAEPAEQLILPRPAYDMLVAKTVAVSDEHRFRLLIALLQASRPQYRA